MFTEEQLKSRWLTPEGEKAKHSILKNIRKSDWEKFLENLSCYNKEKIKKDLRYIDFNGANLWRANLIEADLRGANLWNADLGGAKLYRADLRKAIMEGANLAGADLEEADLSGADLWSAFLGRANLRKSKLINTCLVSASLNNTNLSKANISGANIYGISAWDITVDKETIMQNLIINEEPLITVNDIEIAQFIYLIIKNKKI